MMHNKSYWCYDLGYGFKALAGKTDTDNDYLTMKIASANDYWFHITGKPGSHVIIKNSEDLTPPRDILYKAASIAAWHSKARTAGKVSVSYTFIKNVKKPRGASAGTVTIKQAKKLKVTPRLP
jgi:predicted ribosome quality control (RQC) complex YloA/Tae2 family protein